MNTARSLPWADSIPDATLLARYAAERDETAFGYLVRRHGPTVLGVCLRNAGLRQDAEDAFQAVFLLLAQRAGKLQQPERLANWLYGVAVRVARKARRAARRRRNHEAKIVPPPHLSVDSDWSDLLPLLDDELLKLSEDHRAAVLLCDLQGVSRADAALRLGIPEGTLSSRLNSARAKLAKRLSQRGVTLSLAALTTNALASLPEELISKLQQTMSTFQTSGAIPAPLAALLTGGIFPMRKTLLTLLTITVLGSIGVLASGASDDAKPIPQLQVKGDLPKKEEEPKADPGRASRSKRAKLLEISDLILPDTDTIPVWLDDGKRLMIVEKWGRTQAPKSKARLGQIEVLYGYQQDTFLGLTAKGTRWVGFEQKGFGINTISRIVNREYRAGQESFDKTLDTVEIDHITEGFPIAISPDGKTLFTRAFKDRKSQEENRNPSFEVSIRALDALTGDPIRTLVKVEGEEDFVSSTFSASRDKLYLAVQTTHGAIIRCIETVQGKLLWEKEFKGLSSRVGYSDNHHLVLSDDGKWLAFAHYFKIEMPAPPKSVPQFSDVDNKYSTVSTIHLLDTTHGKETVTLEEQGNGLNAVRAVSSDGRLLAGYCTSRPPNSDRTAAQKVELVIWDTRTGKVLKRWDHNRGKTIVTFVPNQSQVVIWEATGNKNSDPGTLGLWDLSALVK